MFANQNMPHFGDNCSRIENFRTSLMFKKKSKKIKAAYNISSA
jgi:hypothetical protein